MSSAVPPPPERPATINPAEFIALSVVVKAIIAAMPAERDASVPGSARAWINDLSVICQDAISKSTFGVESVRLKAMEHFNRILGSIGGFEGGRDDTH
jgi:hypothetical protein